jgi:uncharacterized membrane protein YccC
MNAETKFALSLLFVFCVGAALIFIGAGGAKLGALFAGVALVIMSTRLIVAIIDRRY